MVRGWHVALLLPLFQGCVGGRRAAEYEGRKLEPAFYPHWVRESAVLPVGYERLGKATAHCRWAALDGEFHGVPLSDVDCRESRLIQALRETAADAGGHLLVERRCSSRALHPGRSEPADIYCKATVARSASGAVLRGPAHDRVTSSVGGQSSVSLGAEAWRVLVDYAPLEKATQREARPSDAVAEYRQMPANHKALGDLVTRCSRGCTPEGAWAGLFAAAGRLGARGLVGARCSSSGAGVMCNGTVSGFIVDPALSSDAR